MNTLTLTSGGGNAIKADSFLARVDGQLRRDVHPLHIALAQGPEFGQADLLMANPLCRHFHELLALPPVGSRIVLSTTLADQAIFEGVVAEHRALADAAHDELRLHVRHILAEQLGGSLWGRYQQSDARAVFVYYGQCTFNDEAAGLASDDTFPMASDHCRIFAPAGKGHLWSVAEILSYLLLCHAPADLALPDLQELGVLAGGIYPPVLHLTGLSLGEALAKVAQHAGLILAGSTRGPGSQSDSRIRFQRVGEGRRRSVRLQMPGQTFSPGQSNLWKANISLHRRSGRRGILLLGAPRRYEATFALQKGWDLAQQTADHARYTRSRQGQWESVANTYRRWVLNEAGLYDAAPYNLPRYDFGAISAADFFLCVGRRFEPCLSVDACSASQGILVEISCDGGQNYKRYGGPVRVAHDQCAIFLADDALPSEYFQAAVAGSAQVRVTATVAADQRLYYYIPGESGCGVSVLEFPQARSSSIHASSVFAGQGPSSPFVRDDSLRLEQIAQTLRQSANTLEARIALASLDCLWQIGDKVEAVDGRCLSLGSAGGQMPLVERIEHDCQDAFTTLTIRG